MLSQDLIEAVAPTAEEAEEKLVQQCGYWETDHPNVHVTEARKVQADGGDCYVASVLVTYIPVVTHPDFHTGTGTDLLLP